MNYPGWVIRQFEGDLGISSPIEILEAAFVESEDGGVLWAVRDLNDAARLISGLSPSDRDFLAAGGVLTTGPVGKEISLSRIGDGVRLSLQARRIASNSGELPRVPGFVLTGSLENPPQSTASASVFSWNVYEGLTREQDELARDWLRRRGYADVQVEAHYGVDWFIAPLGAAVSLILMGGAALLITREVLSELAVSMRSILAALRAVGVRTQFIRGVMLRVMTLVMGTSLALAGLAVATVTGALYVRAPTAFTIANGQWWLLVLYLLVACVSGIAAMLTAARKLKHTEALPIL
ncbi:MAG: hypothetical protein QM619_08765 [Micropruina sp.]|uniref:hypothetical protein n=1 Tax=Micropruina sp. TaxID=2737536 RepID=UPI0039E2C914